MGGSHITDVTNASRTMLMNIHTISWDTDMLEVMGVPSSILPEIKSSSDPEFFGYTREDGPFGGKIPVAGILGDQQAGTVRSDLFCERRGKEHLWDRRIPAFKYRY